MIVVVVLAAMLFGGILGYAFGYRAGFFEGWEFALTGEEARGGESGVAPWR